MSTLKLDTLSNKAGTASVPSDTIVSGTAKAWVNFNGTGTVAIRRAFNVSSITDNGTGDYTVNFTTAMLDGNYSIAFGHQYATTGADDSGISPQIISTTPYSPQANSVRILMKYNTSNYDCSTVAVTIFH